MQTAHLDPVRSEQLRLLYEALPLALFATVVNALVLVAILWGQVTASVLLGWLAAAGLVSALRYLMFRAYRAGKVAPPSARLWQVAFQTGVVAAGLIWGGSILVVFPQSSSAHQILLALVIAGVCAGAVSTLSYQWQAIAQFLVITLLPVVGRFLLGGDDLSLAVALMAALFLLMLLISARRIYRTNQTNLELRDAASARASEAKASEARFRHLLQAAPDALLIVDPDNRIEYANQRAQDLFGYPGETLLQCPLIRLLPKLKQFNGRLPPEDTQRNLFAYTQDGRRFPSDVSFSSIPFAEGSRICLAVRDVTERWQNEESLRQAKVAAEAANQAKSAFLSSMSHELRTPLNAILGFSELMLDEPNLTAEQQDNVREIFSSGEHLLKLINDVLDLSRIEAGRMQLAIERVQLQDIIEACRHMIEPLARKNGIILSFELDDCRRTLVLADRTRLLQALLNLASNAIKYNHAGGTVTLACERRAGRLRLSVKDTGPGISPEKQRDLFSPFSRLGKEFSNIEGSGIGLALTKQLVELMDGELGFSSSPGQGSVFWLDLPYLGEEAGAASPAA
ncbi:PAS domain S-box-containing protein [Sulfuritortus calidifontis]|uniref:histidine kinase n=1 Tax=Sulfuritortus calidifontis TaxID=1914471 RepID=A0A4R3JU44_9PROT|nr:ATP-binding protein [Sulfuritortus calidifontis]TCS71170.1 PAS domain S-box-containing protein [Sulfuritortus calidifontis]